MEGKFTFLETLFCAFWSVERLDSFTIHFWSSTCLTRQLSSGFHLARPILEEKALKSYYFVFFNTAQFYLIPINVKSVRWQWDYACNVEATEVQSHILTGDPLCIDIDASISSSSVLGIWRCPSQSLQRIFSSSKVPFQGHGCHFDAHPSGMHSLICKKIHLFLLSFFFLRINFQSRIFHRSYNFYQFFNHTFHPLLSNLTKFFDFNLN